MNKCLLIYHKEDNDGVISAALLYDWMNKELKIDVKNIDLLPADYNILNKFSKAYNQDNLCELHEKYDTIIMCDISFNNMNFMHDLYQEFKESLIWFDHHAPVIKASYQYKFGNCPGIRNTNKSTILCIWEYLYDQFNLDYKDKKVPELLRILSAWDSWSYEREGYDFKYVRNINKGITDMYSLDIFNVLNDIDKFIDNNLELIDKAEERGQLLNEYDDKNNSILIENYGDISWKIITDEKEYDDAHGHWGPTFRTACALFIQSPSNSKMFKSLIKGNKDDIMNGIVFKHNNDSTWTISLYNIRDNEPDVSIGGFHCGDFLRKKYNGGGHSGAAGCTVDEKTFIKILKNKSL